MAIKGGRAEAFTRPPGPLPDGSYPRPCADEVPWRSRHYAPWSLSADGNSYKPGDPIPLAEAIRQGIVDSEAPPPEILPFCERCKGGKWFTNPRPKGHMLDCACRFCQPCPRCGGTGREKEAA